MLGSLKLISQIPEKRCLSTLPKNLFVFKWRSKMYFAVRQTFVCRSSPKIFDCLSEALCWILLNVHKLPFILHLLDDFLVIDFPNSPLYLCISKLK